MSDRIKLGTLLADSIYLQAAEWLLRRLHVRRTDGTVYFGAAAHDEDMTFEESYDDAGLTFDPETDISYVDFQEGGTVCVGYWWGNSNLYFPFTIKDWNGALLLVGRAE